MNNLEIESCLKKIIEESNDYKDLWSKFLQLYKLENICELGVYRGEFAKALLKRCDSIKRYIMIDPWKNLVDWNKPANHKDNKFDAFYQETLEKTDFAKHKRVVLRGTTTEVINQIDDESLDFLFIDGDHTLKGISVDIINDWKNVKKNGFIAGDYF